MTGKRKTKSGGRLAWIEALLAAETWPDSCIEWPFGRSNGYGWVYVGRTIGAHRYICTLAHGEPPTPEHEAAHSCGKGHLGCVNPAHLRWATVKENAADRKLHGTNLEGERAPGAKLSDADVGRIFELRAAGKSHREIGEELGVTRRTVGETIAGNTRTSSHSGVPQEIVGINMNFKLSEDDVREIHRLRSTGLLQRDIAAKFGVSASTISLILTGKHRNNDKAAHRVQTSRASLSDINVRDIHVLWARGGLSQKEIAARYGAAQTTVNEILSGRERKSLHPDNDPITAAYMAAANDNAASSIAA